MATYEKRGNKVRVKIRLLNVDDSQTFTNKTDARKWATDREGEILAGVHGAIPDKKIKDLLERFSNTLDPLARRADIIRLKRIVRDDPIAEVHLKDFSSKDVAKWRDNRLKNVSAASVRREWNLLSPACTIAVIEWKWLRVNPFKEVKRPPKPESRDRRPQPAEIEQIIHASGYEAVDLVTQTSRVCAAFLFACETAMRIGEICNIYPDDVFTDLKFLKITGNKIGAKKTRGAVRNVPLSPAALEVVNKLLPTAVKDQPLFRITSTQTADALWREKIIKKTTIQDLHFHDSRHEGVTRLAQKLEILDLARSIGVVDLKTLMVYYNPTATEVAARLAA